MTSWAAAMPEAAVLVERPAQAKAWRTEVPDGCPLTNTEFETMTLVAAGKSVKEIALHLGRTGSTARSHIYTACQRLGVPTRVQAVIVMKDSGWLGAPPRRPNEPDPPLTHGQMLYLSAFDLLLKNRTREAEAAVTICFAAMCWEADVRPQRRPCDVDGWLLSMGRRLTARRPELEVAHA